MTIISIIFPLLAIASAGYLSANRRLLSEGECDGISKFVFGFIIPTLLFNNTAKAKLPEQFAWDFLASYYIAVVGVFLLSIFLSKRLFQYNEAEQGVFAVGTSYSNAVIVGIPVCSFAFGEASLLPIFIIISIHNLVLFTLGILTAERSALSIDSLLRDIAQIVKQLVTSPITGSLIAGLLVNMSGLTLYKPLDQAIGLFSQAAIPCALFILGASLNKYQIHGHITPAVWMVALKMVLIPSITAVLAFQVFELDRDWASIAVMTAAMPVGINAYIFSQKYQVAEAPVATGIVISTLICPLSLAVIIAWLSP